MSSWAAPTERQRATYRDLLVFNEDGLIDNQLRFPDECVRHKVLDLIGDLALSGCDLHGRIRAHRSGHRLNAELVRGLLQDYQMDNRWEDLLPERRRCA